MSSIRGRRIIEACAVLLMFTFSIGEAVDMRAYIGKLTEWRSTGYSSNLDVELKFVGDDVDGVGGLRYIVTKAVDDTGRNLIDETRKTNEFSAVDSAKPERAKITVKLKSPARKAVIIKELSGEVEIFKSENDPASILTFTDIVGKPKISLSHSRLTDANVQITLLFKDPNNKDTKESTSKDNSSQADRDIWAAFTYTSDSFMWGGDRSMAVHVKDPDSKFIKLEFLDANGKVIEIKERMWSKKIYSYNLTQPLPSQAQIRVYLATPKSVFKVPFMFRDIALP